MASINCVNTSLFIGDLPKFCSEADLEQLFHPFGPILDVKIKRNNSTGKTLSYGFVTFATELAAAEALKHLDNSMFCGRKLRLRWAMYNAKNQTSTSHGVINSIYVRFVTQRLDRYITEEDFHYVFDAFGNVLDVSIKESSIDNRMGRQSGYGFVHFSCDMKGVEAAFQAVSTVDNATIDGVTYNVELSKNLLKQFGDARGNLDQQALAARFPGQASNLPSANVHQLRSVNPPAPSSHWYPDSATNSLSSHSSNPMQFISGGGGRPSLVSSWSQPSSNSLRRDNYSFSGLPERQYGHYSVPTQSELLPMQRFQAEYQPSRVSGNESVGRPWIMPQGIIGDQSSAGRFPPLPSVFDDLNTCRTTVCQDIFASDCDATAPFDNSKFSFETSRPYSRSHSTASHASKSDGSLTDDEFPEKINKSKEFSSPYFYKNPSNESLRSSDTDVYAGVPAINALSTGFNALSFH